MARSRRPRNPLLAASQVGRPVLLFLCFTSFAQNVETPHDTVQRVKGIGLAAKTVDQIEPLLDHAVQGWAELNPRSLEYAQALVMLGMVRQFLADVDILALRNNVDPLYKRALAVYDRSVAQPDPADLALALELRAAVLNATGEVQEATLLSERALGIRKSRVRALQEGAVKMSTAYKPGEGITAPTVASKSDPAYTTEATFLRIEGASTLRVVVDENGLPQDIGLVRSLGYGLDENAVQAVRTWRFVPGKDGSGKILPTILNIDVPFKLEPKSKP